MSLRALTRTGVARRLPLRESTEVKYLNLHPPGFKPGDNLPFQVKSTGRLAANWIVFCALGFGAPLIVMKFQRWKASA